MLPLSDNSRAQFIRFARVCYKVDDFNNRSNFFMSKLINQGY